MYTLKETATVPSSNRKEMLEKCREYHQPMLDLLNAKPGQFTIKPGFYSPSAVRMIGLYPEDINRGMDIFVELVTRENQPSEPDRPLFRWKYNPHAMEEYELGSKGSYLIPVEELEKINPIELTALGEGVLDKVSTKKPAEKKPLSLSNLTAVPAPTAATIVTPVDSLDAPFANLSVKEAAAIIWRLPISGNQKIDQFIREYK